MTKPVLNIQDAETTTFNPEGSTRFGATIARLGDAIGAKQLGCAYMQVEPGKRAYPFHCHHGNEEMMIILEGEGSYRFGDQTYPIKAGDICAAPAGGLETAHQITNTGQTVLRYICLSTKNDPDICEYPDSGKFAAFAIGEGQSFRDAKLMTINRTENGLDYFDGEEM